MAKAIYYSSILKSDQHSYIGWKTLWEGNYWSLKLAEDMLAKKMNGHPGSIGIVNRKSVKGAFREMRRYANFKGTVERVN